MVERRRRDAHTSLGIARKRTGLNDLVDVTREALAFRVRRVGARVDLDFRVAQRRRRARGIVIERAIHRYALEHVTYLIEVTPSNRDGLEIPGLVRDDV